MTELKALIIKLKGHNLGVVDINESEGWVKKYSHIPTEQEVLNDYRNRLKIIRRNLS